MISKTRTIDPFFYNAINEVFKNPSKKGFVMDGAIGLGKSSNFVMLGAYTISQCVEPIKKGNRMVRQCLWAAIRESEQSALSTVMQLIGESIFTPEVMAMDNSPVTQKGSHPTVVTISHKLPDNTYLEMNIRCYGFDNEKSHNRLRTHEFMGSMVFELQGIPFNIFEVAMQRCGRYRTETLKISRVIDGKKYTLTGIEQTSITLADLNIPSRPHPLYERYYDINDKDSLPYMFITPPSPLLPIPIDRVNDNVRMEYPVTQYEGEKVVWIPNKECYHMTRHFERRDEEDNSIPWTGYNYWMGNLHLSDSEVRRNVLGRPDTIGGASSVYKNFRRSDTTVCEKDINPHSPIYVAYDPGGYAAIQFIQVFNRVHIHVHQEITFEPSDGVGVRQQIEEYIVQYCETKFKGMHIVIIPDPASSWLGKSAMLNQSESVQMIINKAIKEPTLRCTYEFQPCRVSNQETEARINSLSYFIDKGNLSIDPQADTLITGLVGGYAYKVSRNGVISNIIDKASIYSHSVEATQYVAVNILFNIRQVERRGERTSRVGKLKIKQRG